MSPAMPSEPTFLVTVTIAGTTIRIVRDRHSTIITAGGLIRSQPAWEVGITPGAIDAVAWFDRLLARWEVSRFTVVPFSISIFATPFTVTSFFLSLSSDRYVLILALILVSFWALPIMFDQARGWWLFRYPHASPRWLRSVRSAVGTSVFDEALDHLTAVHGHDPDYRIERAHLAEAVRYARRKHWQRFHEVRLDTAARHA